MKYMIGGFLSFLIVAAVMVLLAWVSIFGWSWPCGSHSPIC